MDIAVPAPFVWKYRYSSKAGDRPPLTAFRRLDDSLHEAERRLITWGTWTRAQAEGGYPKQSTSESMRQGRLEIGAVRPLTELPQEVVDVDHAVASLDQFLQRVAQTNWQYIELMREQKAKRAGVSEGTFKRYVNEIRLHVKNQLKV
jgi:hypothetical protein